MMLFRLYMLTESYNIVHELKIFFMFFKILLKNYNEC